MVVKELHKGVVVDGKECPLDILICAAVFDTSSWPRYPILGIDGRNLQEGWARDATAYMGVVESGCPNYIIINGPSSLVGTGTILPAIGKLIIWNITRMTKNCADNRVQNPKLTTC